MQSLDGAMTGRIRVKASAILLAVSAALSVGPVAGVGLDPAGASVACREAVRSTEAAEQRNSAKRHCGRPRTADIGCCRDPGRRLDTRDGDRRPFETRRRGWSRYLDRNMEQHRRREWSLHADRPAERPGRRSNPDDRRCRKPVSGAAPERRLRQARPGIRGGTAVAKLRPSHQACRTM